MVVPSRCLKSLEDRRNSSRFHAMKAAIRHARLSSSIPKADFSGRLFLMSGRQTRDEMLAQNAAVLAAACRDLMR
jgi:hypothetical protein